MASVGGVLYTLTVIKKRPGVRALKLRGFTYHNLIIGRLYRSLNCMSVIASTRSRNAACPVIPPVHTDPALAHTALQAARKGPESGANQTFSFILGMSEMYWNRSFLARSPEGYFRPVVDLRSECRDGNNVLILLENSLRSQMHEIIPGGYQ
jgi:hypothetical protein